VYESHFTYRAHELHITVVQGLIMQPIFLNFTRNSADLGRAEFRIFKFKIFEKSKKICKKLYQIIRTLVKNFFQILTVLLDKIQIELKISKWVHLPHYYSRI
jgi:hypothetical protein